MRTMNLLLLTVSLTLTITACDSGIDGVDVETRNASAQPSAEETEEARIAEILSLENCAWRGPYVRENTKADVGLLDYGAYYWTLFGTAPTGASLRLKGKYPRARYFSFNTYKMNGTTAPYHGLVDKIIEPNAGQPANPFLTGNKRGVDSTYTIDVVWDDDNDSTNNDLGPNQLLTDLYDQATYDAQYASDYLSIFPTFNALERGFEMMYRVYVHDEAADGLGGVDFPQMELTLNGVTYDDQEEICQLLAIKDSTIDAPLMDAEKQYRPLRENGNPYTPKDYYKDENGQPAENGEITWRASYDQGHDMRCPFLGQCEREGPRAVGFYPNLDNGYLNTWVDNRKGAVILTEGKLPITPKTLAGGGTYDDTDAQLRYWSLCSYEFYSQRNTDCVFDEQLLLDEDRRYAIVTSKKKDRPENAIEACGYNWLEFPEWGDNLALLHDPSKSTGRINNDYDALLLNRQMTRYDGFDQGVQSTATPGDEIRVMGEYLQRSRYLSVVAFEELPCRNVVR